MTISCAAAAFQELTCIEPIDQDAIRLHSVDGLAAAFRIAREVRATRDAGVLESSAWELLAVVAHQPHLAEEPPRWAWHAYETIMDRAMEAGLGVGEVAAQAGVHPVHLARVFCEAWGCSPGELLRWRGVDRAADLLRRPEISCARIAAEVGFVDQSHMSRAFRAAYGVAPGVYRRAHVAQIQDLRL